MKEGRRQISGVEQATANDVAEAEQESQTKIREVDEEDQKVREDLVSQVVGRGAYERQTERQFEERRSARFEPYGSDDYWHLGLRADRRGD